MRLSRNVTLACISLLALASAALADTTSDARKAIQGLYDTDNAAAKRKDVNALFAHTSSDFVAIDKSGKKHTLAETKQMIPMLFSMMQDLKAESRVNTIKLSGSSATVTVDESMSAKMVNPQNQKSASVSMTQTSKDVWVKSAKGWMKKQSTSIKENTLVNGKPAKPGSL